MTRAGPRLAKLAPASLDAEQRQVYDAIAGGRRASGPTLFTLVDDDGALEGPFNGFLLQPRVGRALEALGSAVRFETTFSDRTREIARRVGVPVFIHQHLLPELGERHGKGEALWKSLLVTEGEAAPANKSL